MSDSATPEPHVSRIDQVVVADHAWFAAHPGARHRWRPYVEHEFDRHDHTWSVVIVTLLHEAHDPGIKHPVRIGRGPVVVDDRYGPVVTVRSPLAEGEEPATGRVSLVVFRPGETAEELLERLQDEPMLSDDLWAGFEATAEKGQP